MTVVPYIFLNSKSSTLHAPLQVKKKCTLKIQTLGNSLVPCFLSVYNGLPSGTMPRAPNKLSAT